MGRSPRNKTPTPVLPIFWPLVAPTAMFKAGTALTSRHLAFLAEEEKFHSRLQPLLAIASHCWISGRWYCAITPIRTPRGCRPLSVRLTRTTVQ